MNTSQISKLRYFFRSEHTEFFTDSVCVPVQIVAPKQCDRLIFGTEFNVPRKQHDGLKPIYVARPKPILFKVPTLVELTKKFGVHQSSKQNI